MAKTSAERMRDLRGRREREAREAEKTLVGSTYRTPFSKWIEEHGDFSIMEAAFDTAGLMPPTFHDERNPASHSGEIERMFVNDGRPEDSPYAGQKGALARAEIATASLIDAAQALAGAVNAYKQKEIGDRIAEIEAADLSDAKERKRALAEIVKLKKMQDQLSKQVRWTFPQWKVPG